MGAGHPGPVGLDTGQLRPRCWTKGLPEGPSSPKPSALGCGVCRPRPSPSAHRRRRQRLYIEGALPAPQAATGPRCHLHSHSSREMGCKCPTSRSLAQAGEQPDPIRPLKVMHKLFWGGVSMQDRACEQQPWTLMLSPSHSSPLCLLGPAEQQPG